jgi:hypothetical protein
LYVASFARGGARSGFGLLEQFCVVGEMLEFLGHGARKLLAVDQDRRPNPGA